MNEPQPMVLFRGLAADRAVRGLTALLSATCAIVVIAPPVANGVLGAMVANARDPVLAAVMVRYASAAAAIILAAIAFGWPVLIGLAVRGIRAAVALPGSRYIALVISVAAGLRILIALVPTTVAPTDPQWYHTTAVSLASGEGFSFRGAVTAYRPPGYSSLLALGYAAFGPHPALAWIWGILATAVCLVATHQIAVRSYGTTVARIATLGLASYPALAIFTALPVSDLVFAAGLTGLLCAVIRSEFPHWSVTFLIGAALAALTLTRSVGLAFIGAVVFVLWMKRPSRIAVVLHVAVLSVALAIPLVWWAARNDAAFGTFTLATNTGRNLLLGNHAGASGGYPAPGNMPFRGIPIHDLNEADADRRYLQEAIQFIRQNPRAWTALWPKKLVHLFSLELTGAQWLLHERSYPSWIKYGIYAASQLAYMLVAVLLALRLVSFTQQRERPQGLQLTGWIVGATVVLIALVSFGQDRYRMPFLPWMIMEASVMLTRLAGIPLRGRSQ